MVSINMKILIVLCSLFMTLVSSEEIVTNHLTKKIPTTPHETPAKAVLDRAVEPDYRWPEIDPELIAKLNEYTERENTIFVENRKKAREARAKAAATARTAKVPDHSEPEASFDLDMKLGAQIR
ncbi:MAG: hypothetical protein SGBAC_010357, partial [Bacillariaceae sp.]